MLRNREFRLLFAAQGISKFGDRVVAVALAFAVLEVGGGPAEVGLVLAARTLPMVACLLVGGVVADRHSRRSVLLAADLARLASQGTLAALLVTRRPSVWESTLQRHLPAASLSHVSAYDWFGSLAFDPLGLAIWGPIAAVVGVDPALWISCALLVGCALALFAVPEIRRLPAAPLSSPRA